MARVLYEPESLRTRISCVDAVTDSSTYAHAVRAVLLCPFFYAITWTNYPGALVIHTVGSRNSLPAQILCHGSQYGGKIHLAENSSGPLMRHGERISPVHQHSSKVQVEAMEAHGRRARCGERYFGNW